MNYKELNKILTEHKHWLNEEGGGAHTWGIQIYLTWDCSRQT